MIKTIFVTGSTGFIGKNLVQKLILNGYKVVALTTNEKGALLLKKFGAEPIIGDICKPKSFQSELKNCDIAIHLAGLRSNWDDPDKFINVNSKAVQNLFIKSGKLKHIIITSSVYAMGQLEKLPANENHPLKAIDIYGISKIEAEKIAQELSRDTNIPVTIIRPAIVYGPGDNEIAFMSKFIDLIKNKKLPIIGTGENLLHLVHVDDLTNGYLNAIKKKGNNQIYILAYHSPIKFNELHKIAQKELGINSNPPKIPRKLMLPAAYFVEWVFKLGYKISPNIFVKEPPITPLKIRTLFDSWHYDISKARKEIGFNPKIGYRTGIHRLIVKHKHI